FKFTPQWQLVRVKSRQIEFAWGPTKDRALRHTAAIELAVAAGHGPGLRALYVSQLRLRELGEELAAPPAPAVRASSFLPGAEPSLALDGARASAWRSDPAAGRSQSLTIDFQRPRELGGLIVHWRADAYASRYEVEVSDDGARWRTAARVARGTGGPDAF